MGTITGSNTFSVTEEDPEVTESVEIPIVSAAIIEGFGTGRLVHPTLGTYDYDLMPTHYMNVDTDIVVAPKWSSTMVLNGAKFTLWQGYDRDSVVKETWKPTNQAKASMRNTQMRMLLDFFMNPPSPPEFIEWWPNYVNNHGYHVVLLDFSVGGQGVNLDYMTRVNLVTEDVTLTMQIADKIE